jgi:flavin prenyltransferase
MRPIILAFSGASGAIYGRRLLSAILASGRDVHTIFSPSALTVIRQELGVGVREPMAQPSLEWLVGDEPQRLRERMCASDRPAEQAPLGNCIGHDFRSYMAPIASGSFLSGGMVICPCSGSTMASIASGASNNLIHRAADVQIKERRRLIVVPRETPLSLVHLDNMRRITELGGMVMPAMPGWYHGVRDIYDLVDFMVARILDHLEIPHRLMKRWGDTDLGATS